MELKEHLLSSFMVFEGHTDTNSKLHQLRSHSIKNFEKIGFPVKDENWKYTSLEEIMKTPYSVFPKNGKTVKYKDVKPYFLADIDTYKIVFVDGVYSSYLSETTHDGIDACVMSSALFKPKYKDVINQYFNKIAKIDEPLTTLNTAFSKEGAYIHIPKNKIPYKAIEILHLSTGKNTAVMLQPRNLIVLEENAQVQIIERHQSLNKNQVLTNSVTEIFVAKNAVLDYYKIQNDKSKSSLIDNTYINQKDNSRSSVHTFSFGGKLTRNNLNYFQDGSYVDSTLKGVTIIEGKQHVDHHTLVHHRHPDNTSHQDYKGIFSGESTGVFNGKIIVDRIAQKTNAFQQNNNILIDDKATVNSKPQLEIFADDVKCSHGCTVGQLDKEALFYFRSRGIPEKEARSLLMYAFSNDVIESIRIPELRNRIKDLIADKIGVRLGFDL